MRFKFRERASERREIALEREGGLRCLLHWTGPVTGQRNLQFPAIIFRSDQFDMLESKIRFNGLKIGISSVQKKLFSMVTGMTRLIYRGDPVMIPASKTESADTIFACAMH